MENWDHYKLILALHRCGTVRGTAETLNVNHATISRRLVHINQIYEMPVFDRVTGRYQATKLGLEFVSVAERMESLAAEAQRKSRASHQDLSGPIRISMGEPLAQYLLRDALVMFALEYPEIDLILETSIGMVDLDRSEADIVVRATNQPPDHLVGRRLFPFYLCEYCAVDYLLKTKAEDRHWLRYSKSLVGEDWIAKSAFPDTPIILCSDDIVWLHQAALAGHGMMKGACYMGDAEPKLIRLPNAKPVKAQDFWILTHPDLKNTPRIKFLMKYVADVMIQNKDLIQGRLP